VLSVEDFKEWYFRDEDAPPPVQAQVAAAPVAGDTVALALLQSKNCLACHSTDGSEKVGASFKGLFGKTQSVTVDGKPAEVVVDDAYLTAAIREPRTHQVKGYPPTMPVPTLTDDEVGQVVAYVKGLR
jgi:cytochrome c oxidase subunit 2